MSNPLKEINLLTDFGLPDQIINTHYGYLPRLDWMKEEIRRIGNCHIIWNGGLCAIHKGNKEKNLCATRQALRDRGHIEPVRKEKC